MYNTSLYIAHALECLIVRALSPREIAFYRNFGELVFARAISLLINFVGSTCTDLPLVEWATISVYRYVHQRSQYRSRFSFARERDPATNASFAKVPLGEDSDGHNFDFRRENRTAREASFSGRIHTRREIRSPTRNVNPMKLRSRIYR